MHELLKRYQVPLLALVTLLLLALVPSVWNFSPDSGIYVGSALELIEHGRYWFSGAPTLQYYPGVSVMLSPFVALAGENFHVLHLASAAFLLLGVWLVRAYFADQQYGLPGLLIPLLLLCGSIVGLHVFRVLSEGLFLAMSFGALLSWRRWHDGGDARWLAICLILAMLVPLVRFQGIFVGAAIGFAFLIQQFSQPGGQWLKAGTRVIGLAVLLLTPFALWSLRNYLAFTPDTFNLANATFFGQYGLRLYAPGSFEVDWINAEWKYTAYRFAYMLSAFPEAYLGSEIADFSIPLTLAGMLWLITLGALDWWKRASWAERAYVLVSLLFILYHTLKGGKSIYIVDRYWFPVAPFLLLMAVYGVMRSAGLLKRLTGLNVLPGVAVVLLLLVAGNGVRIYAEQLERQPLFAEAQQSLQGLREHVATHLDPDAVIATTDWGVLPHYVQRRSYPVLNDKGHEYSVARMLKYQTGYLAILDGNAAFPEYARQMVEDLPEAFTHRYAGGAPDSRFRVDFYQVDLARLQQYMEGMPKPSR